MVRILHRNITLLLLDGKRMHKSKFFAPYRYTGCPINAIRVFSDLGSEELMLLNTTKVEDSQKYFEYLTRLPKHSSIPIAYGGNIQNIKIAGNLHRNGFDKLIFSSSVLENPDLIRNCSEKWGKQSVSVVINHDIEKGFFFGGEQRTWVSDLEYTPAELAKFIYDLGVGELIIQNSARDGTRMGILENLIELSTPFVSYFQIVIGGGLCFDDLWKLREHSSRLGAFFGAESIFQGEANAVLPRVKP